VRLSTSSSSSVTVNSLTLAPIVANPTTGLNNKLTLSLYVNGQAKGTKQYNGNPVSFSSLNETVANGSPLDLVVKANISSSTTANTTLILQLT
jgi:hypothetical protein